MCVCVCVCVGSVVEVEGEVESNSVLVFFQSLASNVRNISLLILLLDLLLIPICIYRKIMNKLD